MGCVKSQPAVLPSPEEVEFTDPEAKKPEAKSAWAPPPTATTGPVSKYAIAAQPETEVPTFFLSCFLCPQTLSLLSFQVDEPQDDTRILGEHAPPKTDPKKKKKRRKGDDDDDDEDYDVVDATAAKSNIHGLSLLVPFLLVLPLYSSPCSFVTFSLVELLSKYKDTSKKTSNSLITQHKSPEKPTNSSSSNNPTNPASSFHIKNTAIVDEDPDLISVPPRSSDPSSSSSSSVSPSSPTNNLTALTRSSHQQKTITIADDIVIPNIVKRDPYNQPQTDKDTTPRNNNSNNRNNTDKLNSDHQAVV
jgi:hypothetical protein